MTEVEPKEIFLCISAEEEIQSEKLESQKMDLIENIIK